MSEMKHVASTACAERNGADLLPEDGGYLVRFGMERGGAYMVDIETSDQEVQEAFFKNSKEAENCFNRLCKAAESVWEKSGVVLESDVDIHSLVTREQEIGELER